MRQIVKFYKLYKKVISSQERNNNHAVYRCCKIWKFIRQTRVFFFINLLKLDSNREIFLYTIFWNNIKPNIRRRRSKKYVKGKFYDDEEK